MYICFNKTDKNMKNSKIATIVYEQYEENVDMLNPLFKQSELDALIASDSDIVRVDYYINGELVGLKVYTPAQAIAQVTKMQITIGNIYEARESEYGDNWLREKYRNIKRDEKIAALESRQNFYAQFIDRESFEASDLPSMLCCEWSDFKHEIYA